ncbi:hypothetical protein [Bartonella sp. DGB1]|uniref:hypothetical protein n=1 Tax=Bartonella sp. DGB1 TaxID=3239807 RepID=UPI00352382C1
MNEEQLNQQDENNRIDPSFEKVKRKLMRLMFISVTIMVVSIGAVIIAIIMKMNSKNNNSITELQLNNMSQFNLTLPKNTQLISTQLNNNHLLMEFKDNTGKTHFAILDIITKKPILNVNLLFNNID